MYECLPPWTVNRSVIQRSPVFRSAPARSKNYLPFGEFFAAGYLVVDIMSLQLAALQDLCRYRLRALAFLTMASRALVMLTR